jgi:predicted RNA methylase
MFSFAEDTAAQPSLNLDLVQDLANVNERIAIEASSAQQKRTLLGKAADAFAALLSGRAKISSPIATEIMTESLGGSDAEGAWTPQDLYNAVESGLVRTLLAEGVPADAASALALLSEIDALLVPRRRRSEEGVLLQQFSTPPAYAWVAARAAALVGAEDLVLEPSAGTGLLALFARLAGARISVNEIDEDRLALLDALSPIASTAYDARYLSALYKGDQPSVVVMNPPFSIDHNLGSDRRVRALALSHVEQALRVMRRGGRLVTIVGHSQHPAVNSAIWENVLQRATVRAAYSIDPDVYKHMGTTFGTALVVLDATVDSERPQLYTSPMSLSDVVAALDEIPSRMGVSTATKHAGGQVVSIEELRTRAEAVKAFAFRENPVPLSYRERTELDNLNDDGRYAEYVPQTIVIDAARPHPTPLVESAALACVRPPIPSYVPYLMPSLVKDGILSDAQLEAVIYAGEAHAKTFELIETDEFEKAHSVEVRRGWMSGYGTGFGKGRTNAAIVADNFAQGRRKAIWFSESPALQEDAERDWKALTGDESTIFTLSGMPVDVKLEREHGILFCTYATLRSKSKKNPRTRLDQIVEWLGGEDFDGAIMFDECHNLANAIPSRGNIGLQSGSLQGQAALDLQRRVPNARIVYVSATSASKIDALAYAPRLGLWGIGTAFANREQFLTKLDSGGTAAFELLCRDMKALGMYLSASLSYEGVTFERLVHKLTDEQKEQFNVLAGVWRLILANVNTSLDNSDASGLARAAALSALESTRLRSLQAMTTSQKLPTVMDDVDRRLADGQSVVIQLTNTNEAAQEKALSRLGEEGDLDDLDMSPKEMLLDYVERCFPTQQYVERLSDDGNIVSEPLLDNEGRPVANPESVAMRESLKAHLVSVLVPTGPLDYLLETFGPDAVAEVTGRRRRVVYREINGRRTRVLEERGAHANSAEMQAFREGKKRILIFSEGAGGTGFSYHADLSGQNTQRRVHYLLQTGYRSDRALQGMGRTHRTNQASAPHYILCVTDIPGEMRFISVIARRLEALGALTRGQRDAASGGVFNAEDNLETQWGALAVASLLKTIGQSGLEGLSYDQWLAQTGLSLFDSEGNAKAAQIPITRFLNRVLCCDLGPAGGVQGLIMDALMEQLEHVIEAAKRDGKFDHGIQTIPALSLVKNAQETIHTHEDSGATTSVVEITATVPREAKTYGQIHAMVARARERYGRAAAFFFEHPEYGIAALYPTAATQQRNGSLVPLAKVVTPSRSDTIETAWANSYARSIIEDDAAEVSWKSALEAEGDTVTVRYTMITGTLLPIYDRLPEQMPEVYRVVLDDGERLIGRVIPESQRTHTLKSLGVTASDDPDRTFDLLKNGHMVRLTNRWTFKLSRVNGSQRIELIIPSEMVWSLRGTFQARGLLVETIDYKTRFFVPTGEREKAVFLDLVGQTPLAA